jgi:crotonobetainyl-CoA:carnitine CoA-transferase CaiB-like acyl-CoA transferase
MLTSEIRPKGPFSGLLVVDLARVLDGPFGTTILDDLCARVIGSPSSRTFTSQAKRSI